MAAVSASSPLRGQTGCCAREDGTACSSSVVEPIPIGYDPMGGASFDITAYHAALEDQARARLRTAIPEWVRLGCQTDDVVMTNG